jgi:hypothetical protein
MTGFLSAVRARARIEGTLLRPRTAQPVLKRSASSEPRVASPAL